MYPDSDDSSEDQIENSKNTWSCKVPTSCLLSLLSVFSVKFSRPGLMQQITHQSKNRFRHKNVFITVRNSVPSLLCCLFQFVSSGGLQLLLEIFNSGILEPEDQESWTVVSEIRTNQDQEHHGSAL